MHILIFEPRLSGHHLSWLKYITEDLLSGGHKVSIACDNRQPETILAEIAHLLPSLKVFDIYDGNGKYRGNNKVTALNQCLQESKADEVFINFDEIASNCLRMATIGLLPPHTLHGKINGVYFRPRFLANTFFPPGNLLKHYGFYKLCKQSWLKRIYLMDESLLYVARRRYAGTTFHLLPDPWEGDFSENIEEARNTLNIPKDKFIILNYGIGDRRKGLHLVVEALLAKLPSHKNVFLLCAGKVAKNNSLVKGLSKLEQQGRAKVLNHYVSDQEENLCFTATDAVLLPYIKHFGSSGVLSLGTAAGKLILASDEGLVGTIVRKHKLGLLFESNKVASLKEAITRAAALNPSEKQTCRQRSLDYAKTCDRKAFRESLLLPFS